MCIRGTVGGYYDTTTPDAPVLLQFHLYWYYRAMPDGDRGQATDQIELRAASPKEAKHHVGSTTKSKTLGDARCMHNPCITFINSFI